MLENARSLSPMSGKKQRTKKNQCTSEWEKYTQSCLPSWVKYFEDKRQLTKMTAMEIATSRRNAWNEVLKNRAQQEKEHEQLQSQSQSLRENDSSKTSDSFDKILTETEFKAKTK